MPDWNVEAHHRGENIWLSDVVSLPPGALRNVFEQAGTKSLLAVPLMSSGECIGFKESVLYGEFCKLFFWIVLRWHRELVRRKWTFIHH